VFSLKKMIVGSGVDILEVDRMRDAIERWGDRLLKKIFTKNEIEYSRKRRNFAQHLAARFCAKEALSKAIGGGTGKHLRWTDVEILNDKNGKPQVNLFGPAKRLAQNEKIARVMVSLSHTKGVACANAILVSDEK